MLARLFDEPLEAVFVEEEEGGVAGAGPSVEEEPNEEEGWATVPAGLPEEEERAAAPADPDEEELGDVSVLFCEDEERGGEEEESEEGSELLMFLLAGPMAAALDDSEEEEDPEAAAPAGLSAGLLEEALASDDTSACLTLTDSDGPPLDWPPWTAVFCSITIGGFLPLVPVCPLEEAEAEGNGGVAVGGCSATPSSEALACAIDPDLCPCHAKRDI